MYHTKQIYFIFFSCLSFFAAPLFAAELLVINHFNKPLLFQGQINPEVIPVFHKGLTLPSNHEISVKVMDLQKPTYVSAIVDEEAGESAYFAIEVVKEKIVIHGYIDSGIAYSWNATTLTFCTPDDYRKQGMTCLNSHSTKI